MRILTAEAMRDVDRAAIDELGIPGLVLMENAALGVVEAIGRELPAARSAAIFCGPGNNGGDGLAVARHLHGRGFRLKIFHAAGRSGASGDAGRQLEVCRRMGLEVEPLGEASDLDEVVAGCRGLDLAIDALFGTGLARPLAGRFAELTRRINALPVSRVAVDLPSGLLAGRADIPGPHVEADLTVAFAAPKVAHVFPPAAAACGLVAVADLGIPPRLIENAAGDLRLSTAEELAPLLPPRDPAGHKGDYGHVLVVAGSEGKSGAAILAARGAIRSGAGLVTAAVPAPLLPVVEAASLESMTVALPSDDGGALAEEAAERALAEAAGRQALAVGPGLGRSPGTEAAIHRLVLESDVPLVLDADGINAFAGRPERLAERRGDTVLTPHPGELGRLLGTRTTEIVADRAQAVRRAVERTGCSVVLKGHLTLVGDAAGGVAVNPTGNPGMATGGTGDVLTGMIVGLAAQGLPAPLAARLAVYVHGLAGDLAAVERGEISLSAGDLLSRLPEAFRRLRDG